jgi:hypothetical protein
MAIKELEEVDEVRWRNVRLREVGQFRHVKFGSRLCAPKVSRLEKRRKTMFVELFDSSPPLTPL